MTNNNLHLLRHLSIYPDILFSVLSFKHECGVIHCDLKFESIVFENSGSRAAIKVTDFGFSKRLQAGKNSNANGSGVGAMWVMIGAGLEPEWKILWPQLVGQSTTHMWVSPSLPLNKYSRIPVIPRHQRFWTVTIPKRVIAGRLVLSYTCCCRRKYPSMQKGQRIWWPK